MRNVNRLGIFHIHDRDGIIDDYIPYMLNEISCHLKDLYIVCNGNVNTAGLEKLKKITKRIVIRENKGFDAGGYQYLLTDYIGWKRVREYKELLLFNNSFFGPIDNFDALFGKMEKKRVDFWTLTNTKGNEYSRAPIQSYFINITQRMLHSEDFDNYWKELPLCSSFMDALTEYEEHFAEYFEEKGYRSGVFISNEEYFWGKEQYNLSPYHDLQYELMAYQGYPVLKRKLFALDMNSDSYGVDRQGREQFIQALEYIKRQKRYPMKFIWDNILRCYPLRAIQESCCLMEIFPTVQNEGDYGEDKVTVFLVLRDRNINYDNLKRLENKKVHIVLISDSEKMLQWINHEKFLSKEIHWAHSVKEAITIICARLPVLEKQYKYCCFISDFYWKKGEIPYTTGASKLWEDWENVIGREGYISHVVRLFEENKECGLLVTPRPFHAHYFGERGETVKLEKVTCREFVGRNNLEEYICRSRKKAWWSNCFWTRLSLLKDIGKEIENTKEEISSWEDFDSLCEIMPYWYQKRGYYTEIICSDYFARERLSIEEGCMETLIAQFKKIGEFQSFRELQILLKLYFENIDDIQDFLRNHKKVYIYGAGEKAGTLSHLHCMDMIECFVVSDGRKKCDVLNGRKVKYLSDIKLDINDGIILGLNEKNTNEVMEIFKGMKIEADILQIEDGGMFNGGWLDFSV